MEAGTAVGWGSFMPLGTALGDPRRLRWLEEAHCGLIVFCSEHRSGFPIKVAHKQEKGGQGQASQGYRAGLRSISNMSAVPWPLDMFPQGAIEPARAGGQSLLQGSSGFPGLDPAPLTSGLRQVRDRSSSWSGTHNQPRAQRQRGQTRTGPQTL